MFSRRWYLGPLALILIVGLLGAGGYLIHRAGWMQGYAMGLVAQGGKQAVPSAFGSWGYGYPGRFFGHSPFLSGFGLLIGIMVLVTVGRCMAYLLFGGHMRESKWAAARKGRGPFGGMPPGMPMYGPAGRAWARRWHRMHCQMSPWFEKEDETSDRSEDEGAEDIRESES